MQHVSEQLYKVAVGTFYARPDSLSLCHCCRHRLEWQVLSLLLEVSASLEGHMALPSIELFAVVCDHPGLAVIRADIVHYSYAGRACRSSVHLVRLLLHQLVMQLEGQPHLLRCIGVRGIMMPRILCQVSSSDSLSLATKSHGKPPTGPGSLPT